MIGALSSRRTVERLWAEGVRFGRGPLRLLVRPALAHEVVGTANIGYVIPRKVGSAVLRNRLRRRLRAILRDISVADPSILPPGDYLFRVNASFERWSHAELRRVVVKLLTQVNAPALAL